MSNEALVMQEEWDVVCGVDIMHGQYLLGVDIAKAGDFVCCLFLERFGAATGNLREVSGVACNIEKRFDARDRGLGRLA